MAKQLLIYESAAPVSAARHGNVSFEPVGHYAFSAGINAVPLMAVEFIRAATEYAIVFTEAGNDVLPVVVLGLRPQQNLYLTAGARWQADYVPAFIRRYPFVFAADREHSKLTLCVDDAHPGLNRDGRGERLFGDDGKPSAYVERVLKFLKEYQVHFERTRAFTQRLKAYGLLEPMRAQVTPPQGEKGVARWLHGGAAQQAARAGADALAMLAKTDELELLYLHLYSIRNFIDVKDRFIGSLAQADEVAASVS
jgi:hypothetical protein